MNLSGGTRIWFARDRERGGSWQVHFRHPFLTQVVPPLSDPRSSQFFFPDFLA